MVFSSVSFLFLFLPAVLLLSLLAPRFMRNLLLLLASLFFYAWGESFYVLLMLASITLNFLFGSLIDRSLDQPGRARSWLALGVTVNLALLVWFKYANFLLDNWNELVGLFGFSGLQLEQVHLPLGISFFTFQAISYLVDVYRRQAQHDHKLVNVALYIALFPQLIAGPIVRYHDVAEQLKERRVSLQLAWSGVQRFVYGLAKKMLIANPLGQVADQIFAIGGGELTTELAWLGLLCYSLQIYFDFSGYSDMAIGLGRLFGFRFLENFNYPYIASSVQDFWRRWHISLSSWFRDYLYIPLGGNRLGPLRTYINLLSVFFLCGLWHGASWNFVIWGLVHGGLLVAERAGLGRLLAGLPSGLGHAYTLLVVMLAWVFFRAETLPAALDYFSALFALTPGNTDLHYLGQYLDNKLALILLCGVILATPIGRLLQRWSLARAPGAYAVLNLGWLCGLFFLCSLALAAGAYNPFIYFRF
jgi:alginate O-acetyltransferase complex protein AlgI